jgi:hypothetical protein
LCDCNKLFDKWLILHLLPCSLLNKHCTNLPQSKWLKYLMHYGSLWRTHSLTNLVVSLLQIARMFTNQNDKLVIFFVLHKIP